MRIFLLGFMLSGKSTIGKRLAKRLNYEFIDTDELFESLNNYSVSTFFDTYGEESFREHERAMLRSLDDKDNVVISTGGGMPCFYDNMDVIKQMGISIYLKISSSSIISRYKSSKKRRPLLENKTDEELFSYVDGLLAYREQYYSQANIVTKAEDANVDDILKVLEFYI